MSILPLFGGVAPSSTAIDLSTQENVGICVEFQDIDLSVSKGRGKHRMILNDVSGRINRHSMTAVMGPSGSGKTTLLDVITGRKMPQKGHVSYGHQQQTRQFLTRFTGRVEQQDTLIGNFTVFEMLMYTIDLKCATSLSQAEKESRVDAIIHQLGLQPCRNTLIGVRTSGISGGQAKRVSVGLALVTDVCVLCLDEPTSGLDSYTATEVLKILRRLSTSGVTVAAAIHSPTSYGFQLFDDLLILIRGRLVYCGGNGAPLQQHFMGDARASAPLLNMGEWIVAVVTQADIDGRFEEMAAKMAEVRASACKTPDAAQCTCTCGLSSRFSSHLHTKQSTNTPIWWAVWVLVKNRTIKDYSDPSYLMPRISDKIFIAFLMTSLYYGLGTRNTSSNVNNLSSLLFMYATLPGFTAVAYTPAIVLDKPLFRRERNDGLYTPMAYLLFKVFEECLLALGTSLLLSSAVFFLVGLNGNWLLFWGTFWLTTCTGIVLAYAVSAISPHVDVALSLLPAYVLMLQFFVGLLIRIVDMPGYWRWYARLNFLRYAWNAIMINQFQNESISSFDNIETLRFYNLHDLQASTQLGYIAIFFAAFFCMAWAALLFKK